MRTTRFNKKLPLIAAAAAALILIFVLIFVFSIYPYFYGDGPPYRIAIDPGHGGSDPGAIGIIQETELTEKTAAYLFYMLKKDPNFRPFYCRKLDDGATIAERLERASRKDVMLLISIHGNSSDSSDAYGFECFPTPPGRDYHDESYRLASYIAAEMGNLGSTLRGEGGIRYAYFNADGKRFFINPSDSSVYEEKTFGMIENPLRPSVLVEQCFVTNESDVNLFGTEDGCAKAAEAYYKAICRYYNLQPTQQ